MEGVYFSDPPSKGAPADAEKYSFILLYRLFKWNEIIPYECDSISRYGVRLAGMDGKKGLLFWILQKASI